jgi:aminopeptidase N
MWWGHRVGWKSYHDQWMSEGFATFSGNLYVQYREKSMKEYLNRVRLDKQELTSPDTHGRHYESLGPVWMGERLHSSDAPRAYDVVIYAKGGLILHMLRMMLYDPQSQDLDHRFKDMMRDFTQTYDNKAASTEDFKAIVEKHMTPAMDLERNHRMDWFFRQYVYGTGIPRYEMHYDIQPAGEGQWKVTGEITRVAVPDGWIDILPIYIQQGQNHMRIGFIKAIQQVNKFEIPFKFRPDKVSLNDNEDILADIKQ